MSHAIFGATPFSLPFHFEKWGLGACFDPLKFSTMNSTSVLNYSGESKEVPDSQNDQIFPFHITTQ